MIHMDFACYRFGGLGGGGLEGIPVPGPLGRGGGEIDGAPSGMVIGGRDIALLLCCRFRFGL